MATLVMLMVAAALLAMVVAGSVRNSEKAPALLVIERSPRRTRRTR